jgi:hypothetical protein
MLLSFIFVVVVDFNVDDVILKKITGKQKSPERALKLVIV